MVAKPGLYRRENRPTQKVKAAQVRLLRPLMGLDNIKMGERPVPRSLGERPIFLRSFGLKTLDVRDYFLL